MALTRLIDEEKKFSLSRRTIATNMEIIYNFSLHLPRKIQIKGNSMSVILDPYVSEFETEEQEGQYTFWLRAKIKEVIDDPRPCVPHDDVMAKMDILLQKIKEKQGKVMV